MKKTKITVSILILTLGMSFSVFAKDTKLNFKANSDGQVKVTGKSDKLNEDVTIKVEGDKKIYYLDQNKTNNDGSFEFDFKIDSNKEYNGKINVGGENKTFEFSTKKSDTNKPSGGSASGGSSSSGSGTVTKESDKPVDDKKEKKSVRTRLEGKDRFETCLNIAERFRKENGGKIDNVVITSAYGYADALSGSVFAKKINSPMLLMGKTVEDSKSTIDYINSHLSKKGKIYILGGNGVIDSKFIDRFKSMGYNANNIIRFGGKNRIETCKIIANEVKPQKGKSIVIASSEGFADALSVSVPAANRQYPILLTNKNTLSTDIKDMISKLQPSEVYIVGGQGVISTNVENQVKSLCKNISIFRLGGKNRYETSHKIVEKFKDEKNTTVLLASGDNFPDALTGAVLGAKLNAQLILVNNSSIDKQKKLIQDLNSQEYILLGGKASISELVESKIR